MGLNSGCHAGGGITTAEEKELQEFFARLPSWMRKAVRDDINSMSPEELTELGKYTAERKLDRLLELNREYQGLARRVPKEWRDYCEIQKRDALQDANLPRLHIGRPKKDAMAAEAKLMHQGGKSYNQIAIALNAKYGPGTTTRDAIRKLLSSRRAGSTPDKTQA
jgi:hypothetical protein